MPQSKTPEIERFPVWSIDQEGDLERYEELPSPQKLKDTVLFGIPLTSAFTGDTVKDESLQTYIRNNLLAWVRNFLPLERKLLSSNA